MIQLKQTLCAWGTPDFKAVLKQEIVRGADQLPLQQGLSSGNYVTADPITVMINSVAEMENIIRVRAGIFIRGYSAVAVARTIPLQPVKAMSTVKYSWI